jgi:hypothetical protein
VDAGEEALGVGGGALELLDDLGQVVADLLVFFDAGLEEVEDGGVEEAGLGAGGALGH